MKCSKCGSENVNIQVVNETKLKIKHHSLIYWLLIGWWLKPILWFMLTIPMLIIKLIKGKKYKVVNKEKKYKICQNCGYSEVI